VAGYGGGSNATGGFGSGGGTNGQGVAGIGSNGTGPGVVGVGGNFVATNNADGVQGFATGTGGGVVGHGGGNSGTGLLGFGGAANGQGVAGIGNGAGPGLVGVGGNFIATNNADGVQGFANGTGTGVSGAGGGNSGIGVYGAGGGPNGVGVKGQGTGTGTGLIGTSSGGYGIVGSTSASGYSGLTAITSTAGVAALAATATVNTAYAAYFSGTTVVQGNFYVVSGAKSAAVAHPDGSHRLLYCVESPESWFEDFGEGKIVNGKADVKLDPDFAALIQTDKLHVFLTEHGGHNGLHTTTKGPNGFTVEASPTLAKAAGTSTAQVQGTFSWRVVAKRKDIVGKRLEKVDLPKIKTPDIAALFEPHAAAVPKAPGARSAPKFPEPPKKP